MTSAPRPVGQRGTRQGDALHIQRHPAVIERHSQGAAWALPGKVDKRGETRAQWAGGHRSRVSEDLEEDRVTEPSPDWDWDSIYEQDVLPAYSIGAPQPELAALIDGGKVRSEVLDAGCGHAALSLELAARGFLVVGLDVSEAAVEAASAEAARRGLISASFAQADLIDFGGYDGRFNTVMDSGCLHTLPTQLRQSYVQALHDAAAPGAGLFILAFAKEAFGDLEGPNGFTAEELRETVATLWTVEDVRPASLYANDTHSAGAMPPMGEVQRSADGKLMLPGFLLSARKS